MVTPAFIAAQEIWAGFSSEPMVPVLYGLGQQYLPLWPKLLAIGFWGGATVVALLLFWRVVAQTKHGDSRHLVSPTNSNVFVRLGELRDEGVRLRNQVQVQIGTKAELDSWVGHASAWKDSVVEEVIKLSVVDANQIKTLNRFRPNQALVPNPIPTLVQGIGHQRWADIQNERLTRLERFMGQYRIRAGNSSRRPTAIRIGKGADDAVIEDSAFSGDIEGIVNEGGKRMKSKRNHFWNSPRKR